MESYSANLGTTLPTQVISHSDRPTLDRSDLVSNLQIDARRCHRGTQMQELQWCTETLSPMVSGQWLRFLRTKPGGVLKGNDVDNNAPLELNLTPIITVLPQLPLIETISPKDLSQKLCWLLGVCALLFSSDIERIDVDQYLVIDVQVRQTIVRPKGASQGVHEDKHVYLKPHTQDPALCPVATFLACKTRLDPDAAIGKDRIRNYIKEIMIKMDSTDNAKAPKARAVSSSMAAKKDVGIDGIATHDNWSFRVIFQRFYCLSSSTGINCTIAILD
ncbi:hypothetical protein EDD11_005533 [Mortierella claussenii]|nr:hypothetical protein EDD11_005533 [Mortierella claussenii]